VCCLLCTLYALLHIQWLVSTVLAFLYKFHFPCLKLVYFISFVINRKIRWNLERETWDFILPSFLFMVVNMTFWTTTALYFTWLRPFYYMIWFSAPRNFISFDCYGLIIGLVIIPPHCFLGAFAKFPKVTVSFVMSVCLSVWSRVSAWLTVDGFSWNVMFVYFSKILHEDGAVGWGTVLQTGRSRDRFPMVYWNFSLTSFRPHNGAGVDSASNRNEYHE
jgi:hypothetical protein